MALAVLMGGMAGRVQAGFTITAGNTPQQGDEAVLLERGQIGSTILGTTDRSGAPITFTSTSLPDTLLTTPADGPARIEAEFANGDPGRLVVIDSIAAADT